MQVKIIGGILFLNIDIVDRGNKDIQFRFSCAFDKSPWLINHKSFVAGTNTEVNSRLASLEYFKNFMTRN